VKGTFIEVDAQNGEPEITPVVMEEVFNVVCEDGLLVAEQVLKTICAPVQLAS
jgi:hypothetical protein